MNTIMESYYPVFRLYQSLRDQMMDLLEDEDLAFRLGGSNPTLGTLCREIGEVQHCYIESFRTFEMDLAYNVDQPELEQSVEKLANWYLKLDEELEEAVSAIKQDEIDSRKINRGGDFIISPQKQLEVYQEALLIFYGKSAVYLKALGKELPEQWQHWIA
jgi:uncharacterized damage-inducible protein DinB